MQIVLSFAIFSIFYFKYGRKQVFKNWEKKICSHTTGYRIGVASLHLHFIFDLLHAICLRAFVPWAELSTSSSHIIVIEKWPRHERMTWNTNKNNNTGQNERFIVWTAGARRHYSTRMYIYIASSIHVSPDDTSRPTKWPPRKLIRNLSHILSMLPADLSDKESANSTE